MAEAIITRRGFNSSGSSGFHTETILENTNWTMPSGVINNQISVRLFGGGGGNGGGTSGSQSFPGITWNNINGAGGCGGGGGWMDNAILTITPGTEIPITIGAGGGQNRSGGTTAFGTYMSANGGTCGNLLAGGNGGSGGGTGGIIKHNQSATPAQQGGTGYQFGGGGGLYSGGNGGPWGGGGGASKVAFREYTYYRLISGSISTENPSNGVSSYGSVYGKGGTYGGRGGSGDSNRLATNGTNTIGKLNGILEGWGRRGNSTGSYTLNGPFSGNSSMTHTATIWGGGGGGGYGGNGGDAGPLCTQSVRNNNGLHHSTYFTAYTNYSYTFYAYSSGGGGGYGGNGGDGGNFAGGGGGGYGGDGGNGINGMGGGGGGYGNGAQANREAGLAGGGSGSHNGGSGVCIIQYYT